MTKIEKFEDIKAWQLARDLTREIYQSSNTSFWGFFGQGF